MDHDRLQIAQRIHLGLMRELGQGIDVRQMLHSALYARDVLLVCQAYPRTDLPGLAAQFRSASAEHPAQRRAHTGVASDSRGFDSSQPASGAGGFDDLIDVLPPARLASRRWLQPSTWFTR